MVPELARGKIIAWDPIEGGREDGIKSKLIKG